MARTKNACLTCKPDWCYRQLRLAELSPCIIERPSLWYAAHILDLWGAGSRIEHARSNASCQKCHELMLILDVDQRLPASCQQLSLHSKCTIQATVMAFCAFSCLQPCAHALYLMQHSNSSCEDTLQKGFVFQLNRSSALDDLSSQKSRRVWWRHHQYQ